MLKLLIVGGLKSCTIPIFSIEKPWTCLKTILYISWCLLWYNEDTSSINTSSKKFTQSLCKLIKIQTTNCLFGLICTNIIFFPVYSIFGLPWYSISSCRSQPMEQEGAEMVWVQKGSCLDGRRPTIKWFYGHACHPLPICHADTGLRSMLVLYPVWGDGWNHAILFLCVNIFIILAIKFILLSLQL